MASEENEIRDVMKDEIRASRGLPPLHSTSAEEARRIRAAMLVAIKEGNEQDFIGCVQDLGHTPESDEYHRMMEIWSGRFGGK